MRPNWKVCLTDLQARVAHSPQLLVASDFDGTLSELVDHPADATLHPAAARALLEAVLRVFGLPELLRVFSTNPVVRSPSYADGPAVPQQPGQDMEEADRPRPEPPWHPFIQAGTDVSANPRQDRPDDLACQALVGTSLALAENPARVRTPAFAEQAGAWWAWSNGYAGSTRSGSAQ